MKTFLSKSRLCTTIVCKNGILGRIYYINYILYTCFRLYGSYEALKSGNVGDALTDFSGGVSEYYTIRGKNVNYPKNLVNILFKALDRQSLIGCGINVSFYYLT